MSDIATVAPFAPLALMLGGLVAFGKVTYSRPGIVAVIACAVLSYLYWRVTETIPWDGSFSELWWPLTCLFVEVTALFDAGVLLAILMRPTNRSVEADAGEARLRAQWQSDATQLPPVDIFIATYNEPREVLEKTVLGCRALEWPEARVWVLDDGRREWVRDFCIAKGAGYINRPDNKGAKAGNINHALTQTNAPFVVVFDADFVPRRDFLLRTMGFFENEKIGIVQVPHSFYNHDPMQTTLGLQQSMPDDQRFFFEAIMPGRDGWDASFCCGSNSVTRRTLFEEIGGGLPEGSITEDMLLTLASLRRGYITRYLNEPLAFGLAPESTAAFFVQRQRWAQGALQILHLGCGPLGPGLKLRYRLLFLPSAWLTQGLQSIFMILTPVMFMLFNLSPMVGVDLNSLLFYLLPMIVALLGGITMLAPGRYYPMAAQVLGLFQAFRILPVALQTLFRPKGLVFKVTPKGSNAGGGQWEGTILFWAMFLIGLNVVGLAINVKPDYRLVSQYGLMPVVSFWATLNVILLLLVGMMCLERPRARGEERFSLKQAVTLIGESGQMVICGEGDISISGIGLRLSQDAHFKLDERVQVLLPDVGIVEGVVKRTGQRVGVAFAFQADEVRDRLIVSLFTDRIETNAQRPSSMAVAAAVIKRIWSADLSATSAAAPASEPEVAEAKLEPATRVIAPVIRASEPGRSASKTAEVIPFHPAHRKAG